MIKRLISGALSLLVCSSMFTSEGIGRKPKSVAPQADNPVSSDMDYKISSTNSLGNYISDAMNSQNTLNASASNVQVNDGYAINNFGFDNQTGEVIVKSTQPQNCTVLVTVLEEETNKKACEVKAEVEKGENIITTAKIDISLLPQYYIVKVELVNKKGKSLCTPFTKNTYTKEMQEIIATDIHDFDEEYVVNFDESENTNFLVLSEETVKAESTEETNTLSSADYENGIFVFDNADETLKNLEEGESLFIQPNENDIIAVSVDNVEINENNQLVIEGNDDNVDEMFEFIKFESTTDDIQTIVDTSSADEGISFPELDDKIKQHTLETGAPLNFQYSNKQAKASRSLTVPLDFGKEDADYNRLDDIKDNLIDDEDRVYDDDDDKDDKDDSFDISTSGNLKFQTQINFYKKGFSVKIEFTIEVGLELEAKVGWEKEKKHTIQNEKMNSFSIKVADLSIKTAIPGVCINVEPKIVVDFSASISITVSSSLKFGFTYDSKKKKFQKISEVSPLDYSIDVEGTLELKLVLDPSVVFVSKKIAYATFEAAAGFALEATTEVRKEMADHVNNSSESGEVLILNKSDDSTHGCMACLDGQLDFFVSADAKLSFIGKKIEAELLKLTFPIGVIHISSDTGFGWGECDYERYRVSFDVYDNKTAAPISGALVTLEDLENYTDSSGLASYYCDNTGSSSYKYSVKIGDETVGSGYITVDDAPQTVNIRVSVDEDDEGNKTYSGADSDVAKGEARSTAAPATKPVMTGVTVATAQPVIEQEILSSGKLGENIDFILHDDGNLWIYGYGDMYDDLSNPFESPESVKVVDFEHEDEENGYTINSIGNNVFMGCKNLPEISIPQTVTRIGECAFYGCSALQFGDLVLPSELTSIGGSAFNGCAGLTSVEVPGTVKTIGNYAFGNCTSLKSAVIKDGVENLGNHIFNVCTALEEVTLPYAGPSLTAVNKADSSENVSAILFRNSLEGMTYNTMYYPVPNSLKKITITGGTRIPNNAFKGFGLVEEIVLPDTITSIGDDAFFNCSSLTSVNLTNKLVSIGDSAFLGCSALQFGDLVLPSELTSIGRGAFDGCTGLTSVEVPGTVKTIGDYAFFNCTSLKSAVIKDGVENLGNHMFNVCTALEEVTLPYAGPSLTAVNKADSSEYVSSILFRNIVENSLKKITITGGTRIPSHAFDGFELVEEIVIPDTITSIGLDAFDECEALSEITIYNPDCEIYPEKSTIPEKTIIYGYKDSTAESYALEYDREFKVIESNPDVTTPVITTTQPTTTTVVPEIKPTLYGDANCDGKVSIADATAIFQGLGNPDKYLLSPQGMANGDCFKTGSGITLSDALVIQMYDAKLISNLPVSELPVQR